jgi:hypothetical protein
VYAGKIVKHDKIHTKCLTFYSERKKGRKGWKKEMKINHVSSNFPIFVITKKYVILNSLHFFLANRHFSNSRQNSLKCACLFDLPAMFKFLNCSKIKSWPCRNRKKQQAQPFDDRHRGKKSLVVRIFSTFVKLFFVYHAHLMGFLCLH